MKMKSFAAMAFLAAAVSAQAEPIAYPGSTWGAVVFPSSGTTTEKDNTLFQGKVEQGIDWFRFADNWKFNTYANVSYSLDNRGYDYNNKVVPAIGVKATREFSNGTFDVGAQLVHERRWKSDSEGDALQAYASWWFGWNLKK